MCYAKRDCLIAELRPMSQLDESAIDKFRGVGKFLSKYTAGKLPKAFLHIPSMQLWEEFLYLSEPENWSPNAMYQATRIFASNLCSKKAERFYRPVLLPRVRDDIRKNKRLHFSLHQALKKSLYKPAAFNQGILFPLFKSRTFSLREAVIVGSIIQKFPFPWDHARYKNSLQKEHKDKIRTLVEKQKHKLATPEIIRELDNNSCNHRGKEDDPMLITPPAYVINKPIEEDRFDIPDVPLEED